MNEQLLDRLNIYIWAKDKNYKYLYCNEHYANNKRYYLGDEVFGDVYLTSREIIVFKRILLGFSAREIGEILKISPKTVEAYIENIKLKLQAKTKGEIIATAIQFGLTHIVYLQHEAVSPC